MLRIATVFRRLHSLTGFLYWSSRSEHSRELVPIELRPKFSHLCRLESIGLSGLKFSSFSYFARLLSATPSLKVLIIQSVVWRIIPEPGQVLDCNSGFSNLAVVRCGDMISWPVMWLAAARATGSTYRRAAARSRNVTVTTVSPDISYLVASVKTVEDHFRNDDSFWGWEFDLCSGEDSASH